MNEVNQPISRWTAAKFSLGLCALFLVVYGFCNRVTEYRSDVGVWVYDWERYIPFVPLMIVPYMSIDLFFAAAPFLCRDRAELRTFARRIVFAVLVAAVFYLSMPLKFSFERPPADGVLGLVVNNFRKMDLPYNQFPSLHIALRTILADLYARRTRGPLRWSLNAWFSLIGVSTVLTHQHHVIDIAGGFALGLLCLYLFNPAPWKLPVTRTPRVGAYYIGGAALCVAGAALVPPGWSLLPLYPALSLFLAGGAYFGPGPAVFRKDGGRLPFATLVLLWPVVFGQWLSTRYYARRSRRWDEVTPNLWIGRTLTAREAAAALGAGVTAILDLTAELPEARPFARHPHYRNLPILDLTAPTCAQLDEAVAFIDAHARAGGTVYVHCKAGYSRSAAVAAAYLLRTRRAPTAAAAISALRGARDGIIVRPEALAVAGAV